MEVLSRPAWLLGWAMNGDKDDLTGSNLNFILISASILAVAAALVLVPIGISSRRRNPWGEAIRAGSLFWGIASAWSTLSWATAAWNWAKERNALLLSGYYDPTTAGDGPRPPWIWWIVLGAAYLALLGLASARGRARSPSPPPEPAKHLS